MKPLFFYSLFILSFLFSQAIFASDPQKLVLLGDSLTEGYGVSKDSTYAAVLQTKIKDAGKSWVVVNSGIAGSTTASATSRMKWILKSNPQMVLLALGANDALRGIQPKETKKNLEEAILIVKKENEALAAGKKAPIILVLAGILAPPNYGVKYTQEFSRIFPELVKKYHLRFVPFLLEKVAGDPLLNLADGIHPNEKGHEILADTVFKALREDL